MLCDLGADFDLSDNKGNTPLHYASSWGHIPVLQLLIERGCQYTARNNEGFTASDYAYSFSTRDTLQDTARLQFENNKKTRRTIFAQAAARGSEWGGSMPINMPPPVPSKAREIRQASRMRSGSGTSRTTTTSDSGELDSNGLAQQRSQSSLSASSSPSQPSASQNSFSNHLSSTNGGGAFSGPHLTHSSSLNLPSPNHPASALSPVATRMRERDADAMEKYMRRTRSGSQGTASTDNRSQNGSTPSSAGPSADGDDISSLSHLTPSGSVTPRRLRPSMSAAQLRTTAEPPSIVATATQSENRNRSGTNPTAPRPSLPMLSRSSSTSISRSLISPESVFEESESYTGPPSQYAQFPEPPLAPEDTSTPVGRRLAFHLLSKPLPGIDINGSSSHRRGMSATASVRGT